MVAFPVDLAGLNLNLCLYMFASSVDLFTANFASDILMSNSVLRVGE